MAIIDAAAQDVQGALKKQLSLCNQTTSLWQQLTGSIVSKQNLSKLRLLPDVSSEVHSFGFQRAAAAAVAAQAAAAEEAAQRDFDDEDLASDDEAAQDQAPLQTQLESAEHGHTSAAGTGMKLDCIGHVGMPLNVAGSCQYEHLCGPHFK